MTAHRPYIDTVGHPPDFLVEYRFLTADEGGRKTGAPYQGIRSDFWYEHDNHEMKGIFMIWPEFLNDKGEVIIENDRRVPMTGTASMWIINNDLRQYHQKRITVGTHGFFMEGPKRTAICKVTEIVGLMTNPTKDK